MPAARTAESARPRKPLGSWRQYVLRADPDHLADHLRATTFVSGGEQHELIHFESGTDHPSILISPGSFGHAYVFVELAWNLHVLGYNVFVMPKHGGHTVSELVVRHADAVAHISRTFNERVGIFGEGLGGYAVFYFALADGSMKSIVCQNSPAILTEPAFREAVSQGPGQGRRRKALLPIMRFAAKVVPNLRLPARLYLDFRKMVDPQKENQDIETALVDSYLRDPDFDRWYPLSAIWSLVDTPPPGPLSQLKTPTLFIVGKRGFAPGYVKELFERLPPIPKRLVEVDGSVFWMCSHAAEEARIICDWFDETLRAGVPVARDPTGC